MRTEHTVETLFAFEGNPRELSAVVVEETGSEAYSASCGDVGERGIVVGAVEVFDLSRCDQPVLNGLKRQG